VRGAGYFFAQAHLRDLEAAEEVGCMLCLIEVDCHSPCAMKQSTRHGHGERENLRLYPVKFGKKPLAAQLHE